MHEPKTSHFELLSAFAPSELLDRALEFAATRGYVQHEFGDTTLVLPSSRAVARAA
jgi:S-adenosylmethionine:tRNA ribosyltransferase-isomerase